LQNVITMISTEQRIILKKLLKGNYIEDVKNKLKEKGIKTQKGNEYSDKMISHIFNGRYQNLEVELGILEVYQDRLKEMKDWEDKKNVVLGLKRNDKKNKNDKNKNSDNDDS
jgi:hypothetical protein